MISPTSNISFFKKFNENADQSERSNDILLAVHGQASQQLALHTALVRQLFQSRFRVLGLRPLLPAAD